VAKIVDFLLIGSEKPKRALTFALGLFSRLWASQPRAVAQQDSASAFGQNMLAFMGLVFDPTNF
jgi:hypothetical protein